MKITYNYDINVINDPEIAGELLRDYFFDQDGGKGLGGINTLELRDGVESVGEITIDEFIRPVYFRNGAYMTYYHDGDGVLVFQLPDGRVLANTDCKKTTKWFWTDAEEFGLERRP